MKPTYATFARDAHRELCVQAVAACDVRGHKLLGREVFGYLLGRPTRAGFKVERVPLVPYVTSDDDSIYYADEDQARFDAAIASVFGGRLEVVGRWHTHVYRGRCDDVLEPQINDIDMETTPDGLLEVVCAVYPAPGDAPKSNDSMLATEVGGYVCRLEAWVRRGTRFLACSVRVD